MIKEKRIEANLTEVRTSSKPSNGKGKKIMQETSKAFSILSTSGKIKKKKDKNSKKAKCFACEKVKHFKKDCKTNPAKKSQGGKCDLLYI